MNASRRSVDDRLRTDTAAVDEFHNTMTSVLTVRDAVEAVAFYQRAFGAEEIYRNTYGDGMIVAELAVGEARFRVADEAASQTHKFPGPDTRFYQPASHKAKLRPPELERRSRIRPGVPVTSTHAAVARIPGPANHTAPGHNWMATTVSPRTTRRLTAARHSAIAVTLNHVRAGQEPISRRD